MNFVLLASGQLAALYGTTQSQQIATAVNVLLAARAAVGIASRCYDPAQGLADLQIDGAVLDAGSLVAQIAQIDQALQARGEAVESVLIIGGPVVVPFGQLKNPLPDYDGPVYTDCVYGLVDEDQPMLRWPVGRLPDIGPPGTSILPDLLEAAARNHQRQRADRVLAYTAERWLASSRAVGAAVGSALELWISPPITAAAIDDVALAGVSLVYCNLHGVRNGAFWYGQAHDDTELVPALRPSDLATMDLGGAVVFSQACYGARLALIDEQHALASRLLLQGVSGLVGTLGISYGSPQPPISESDLLAYHFLQAAQQPQVSVGEAFRAAHVGMMRQVLQQQGFLDADDAKTLREFVLYGDPTVCCPPFSSSRSV